MKFSGDTIAAIATPAGEGGLAVLRVSGPEAITLVASSFAGKAELRSAATHTAHFGSLVDSNGSEVDQVVATVFHRPHSYTGEDTVEVSCHGGSLVSRRILEVLLKAGARHAEAGEFTKRAFLNGRMDLMQAEAVADLIHAQSEAAQRSSIAQLRGTLSERINSLRTSLIDAVGLLELELDFAEDGYELIDRTKVKDVLGNVRHSVNELVSTYAVGRYVRDGVRVVLVGPTNAGKSSLLNAFLLENRAIVTDIPGTTRDVIVENLIIDGILFRLADTAGMRSTTDRIEQEGVKRSAQEAEDADILLVVLDISRDLRDQVDQLRPVLQQNKGKKRVVALNKVDLIPTQATDPVGLKGILEGAPIARISALTGEGLRGLEKILSQTILEGSSLEAANGASITNSRHYDSLRRASACLELSLKSLEEAKSGEFIVLDLRSALESLGEITGQVTTEEILNSIFSKFCIGK